MSPITYHSNRTGTLHAAHLNSVRIGYVEARPFGRWFWQLSLVGEGGGHRYGFEDDEQSARDALRAALDYWLQCAGLQLQKIADPPVSEQYWANTDWRLAPRRRYLNLDSKGD